MGRCYYFWAITPGPEFRGISRESGPRSPENRSQGLRPPWGVHASPRRSGAAGRGGSPSGSRAPGGGAHPGRAAGTREAVSGAKRAGSRATRGRTAGKTGVPGGKSGQVCRETAHSGRVSGGSRGAVPGGNRENRAAAARKRRLPAGFCRESSGAAGRKRRVSGLWAAKRGEKKPPHGGFRAGSGAWHGILRTACDGFTLFSNPAPRTRSPSRLYR